MMPSPVRLLVPLLLQVTHMHFWSVCFGACLRVTSAGEAAKPSLPAVSPEAGSMLSLCCR